MSKKIKQRTKELASKELAIKKKLLGKSAGTKKKANRIAKTALIGGGGALIVFALYKAFFQGETKSKKSKGSGGSTAGIIAGKITAFLLPYLGKFLDDFLEKKADSDTEEVEEDTKDQSSD